MNHFLLFYHGAPDYLERRAQFRGEHLMHAWAAAERGELVVAGALADPVDGAILMFAGADKAVAEEFAATTPMSPTVRRALARARMDARVVGELAANPVRPDQA